MRASAWICVTAMLSAALGVGSACSESSCEDTLTCPCTTPTSGDRAVEGECTSIGTSDCTYAACVSGKCTARPLDPGTRCGAGVCDAQGTCQATGGAGGSALIGLGEPCT